MADEQRDPHMGGMFTTPEQIRRIAELQARIRVHNEAVQASLPNEGGNPEVKEYLDRWRAFVTEVNTLGANAESTWHSVDDWQIASAEAQFDRLRNEWNEVIPTEIKLRRQGRQLSILREGLKHVTPAKAGETHTPIKLPDTTPQIQPSAASATNAAKIAAATAPPPPPTDPNLPLKAGAVGVLFLGTVVATVSAKGDAARAGIGLGGAALTAVAAWALFSPSKPAPGPTSTSPGSSSTAAAPPASSGSGGGPTT